MMTRSSKKSEPELDESVVDQLPDLIQIYPCHVLTFHRTRHQTHKQMTFFIDDSELNTIWKNITQSNILRSYLLFFTQKKNRDF